MAQFLNHGHEESIKALNASMMFFGSKKLARSTVCRFEAVMKPSVKAPVTTLILNLRLITYVDNVFFFL